MISMQTWDRIATRGNSSTPRTDTVVYGPEGPTERELKLLGDVRGKRVLDLGCGTGQAGITFAKQGATVIGVDGSAEQLSMAHKFASQNEVRIEWHQSDAADLPFLRADSFDLVFSAFLAGEVEDLDRWFRQVHRILRPGAAFVFSYEHPFKTATARNQLGVSGGLALGSVVVNRPYSDDAPIIVDIEGEPITLIPRTISQVFTSLSRAGFRIDALVEPEPTMSAENKPMLPACIVWRTRKEGVGR